MNKSVKYNTFTTCSNSPLNGDVFDVSEDGDYILHEGTLVLSNSSNIMGIRKLSALKFTINVKNSYPRSFFYGPEESRTEVPWLVNDIPSDPYQVQICCIPDSTVFAGRFQEGYNVSFPIPQQTIAVVSLQSLVENGFEWSGSMEIPPGYFICALLWELVPKNQQPLHYINLVNDVTASASLRLTF